MPEFPVSEFLQTQERKLAAESSPYTAQSNYVSALGHFCDRYLVYKRTRGKEAAPISPDLQSLFDEGKQQELVTIDIIRRMGYAYERGQEELGWKDLQIRGRMEGVVMKRDDSGRVVGQWAAEIKKVHEYVWEKLNVWTDLFNSAWHRRWIVQLQLAIFHVASREGWNDTGVFFLKHTGKMLVKPISMPLDMNIVDAAFEKAKRINAHIDADTLPDRIEFTTGNCRGCDFFNICQPEEVFQAGENITDQEFIAKLERREILNKEAAEYKRLDTEVKAILKGKAYSVAGPFLITGKSNTAGAWYTTIERKLSNEAAAAVRAAAEGV